MDFNGKAPVPVRAYANSQSMNFRYENGISIVEVGGKEAYFWVGDGKGTYINNDGKMIVNDAQIYYELGLQLPSYGCMNVSDELIAFVADYEQFYSMPYRGQDSQNRTVGYGHVITAADGSRYDNGISQDEALNLLKSDLSKAVNQVNSFLSNNKIRVLQQQFDALVSFTFNAGSAWMNDSTLMKVLKDGAMNNASVKDAFLRWVYVNRRKSLGLYRRRVDEAEMFIHGDYVRDYVESPSSDYV